jgi:hypothetical protein
MTVEIKNLTLLWSSLDPNVAGDWLAPDFTVTDQHVDVTVTGSADYNITWWCETRYMCNNNIFND